jgi:hypothetical protein
MAQAKSLLGPFAALLALMYLVVMWQAGAPPERTHLIKYEAKGVLTVDPETIVRVTVRGKGGTQTFEKRGGAWFKTAHGDGAAVPKAMSDALSLAVRFMNTANPVRVFEANELPADPSKAFGLDDPALSVTLSTENGKVLAADFGNLSSDGFLHYMRVEGRESYFLMSRFVLQEWQKVAKAGP